MAIFGTKKESKQETQYASDAFKTSGGSSVKVATVLLQPRISEKVGRMVSLNKYVFNVKPTANKVEVKKAVESVYKVHVMQVNMIKTQGKTRNFGNRSGRTSNFKKAIVTLKKGDSIKGLTDVV